MILRILAASLLLPLAVFSQTQMVQLFQGGVRIDDFVMRNNGVGYLANNLPDQVLKTTDGGLTFTPVLTAAQFGSNPYLRSIKTMGDSVVFLGTLSANHTLYRSLDAGQSWQNITPLLPDSVHALCGLSVVGDSVIYGTGRYFGDAYLIKSSDSGATWRYIDMKPWASNLVDVHFFTSRHGYVLGRAANPNQGAILLETRTGGNSWTVKWTSNVAGDRAWKFFMRDSAHFYVSIENSLNIPNRYYVSDDAGFSWRIDTMGNLTLSMLQSVGFINADTGFAGGHFAGYAYTYDGGANWQVSGPFQGFNRMQMMGDRLFLAGRTFNYFGPANSVSVKPSFYLPLKKIHRIERLYPNPVNSDGKLTVRFIAAKPTNIGFALTDVQGKILFEWPNMQADVGSNDLELRMPVLSNGTYLLQVFTDIEHHQQKVVIR
jgi:photosystem II stability/assembly factor-like uncharacterized protein